MSVIYYAVEISLTTSTADLPTYGIDYDAGDGYSTMRLITGTPRYDGSQIGVTYEDTSGNTDVWHEGFIVENGLSVASRRVDLSMTGDYGTLSGFNFTINNSMIAGTSNPIWQVYANNDIYLTGQNVRLWIVIDGVFYAGWNGIVFNNPYNESDFKFVCKDSFYNIHKNIPNILINSSSYPEANEDSFGDPIPIVFGDVKYSELKSVDGTLVWDNAKRYGYGRTTKLIPFGITGATVTSEKQQINIASPEYTGLQNIAFADGLVDHYIFNIAGTDNDSNRGIRIISSSSSSAVGGDGSTVYSASLILEEPFETDFVSANYYTGTPTDDTAWFRIARLNVVNAISTKEISALKTINGRDFIFQYDSDLKKYTPINQISAEYDLTASNDYNCPNVDIKNANITKKGGVTYLSVIPYNDIEININASYMHFNGQSVDNLSDYDRTTYLSYIFNLYPSTTTNFFDIDITLDLSTDYSKYNDMYVCFDMSTVSITKDFRMLIVWEAIDSYGNAWAEDESTYYPDQYADVSGVINFIPNEYYNIGNDFSEESYWGKKIDYGFGDIDSNAFIKLPDFIKNKLTSDGIVKKIRMNVYFLSITTNETGLLLIKQVAVIGTKEIDLLSDSIYATVSGELYDTGVETSNVYNAYRHMLENYDGLTTSTSIFTDSVMYDTLEDNRNGWHVGRTIYESKNTFEYLKELATESFTCIVPNRYGKRKIIPWLDNITSLYTITDTPGVGEIGILRDSITNYEKVNADKIFNEFQIDYNWSKGQKKYTRSYSIKKVDQLAFPASTEDWSQYFSGDIGYSDAKNLWEQCHNVYLRYGMIRQHKKELKWYIDRLEFDEDTATGYGTDSSAYKYLLNCINWISRQKSLSSFSIALNSDTMLIEPGDYITFNDSIYTNGANQYGYVQKIEYNCKESKIGLQCILGPIDDLGDVVGGDIVESGSWSDTITESGSQADTITEDGA